MVLLNWRGLLEIIPPSMAVAFTVEVIGSGVEVIVSPESAGTYNGTLNAFKGLTTGFILSIWAGVCFKYYLKVRTNSGKAHTFRSSCCSNSSISLSFLNFKDCDATQVRSLIIGV